MIRQNYLIKMAFAILTIMLIKIKAEDLKLGFQNLMQSKQNKKPNIYLENFFSWQDPKVKVFNYFQINDLISTTESTDNLIQSFNNNFKNISYNLVNNFDFTTRTLNSDLNLMNNLAYSNLPSSFENLSSSTLSNSSLDISTNFTEIISEFNLTSNLTKFKEELTSNVSSADTLYDVPVYLIVLLAIAYGLVSLTAVIGNSIVLWVVVRSRKYRTVTNIFIANLAIADILIGAFAIPFQFQAALLQRWSLPEIMCGFCSFIQIVSVNVSIFTLSAIAADRYLVVFYPLKYRISKKLAKFIIAFIWLFSVLAAMPALIALKVVYIPDLMNVIINQELSSALLNSLTSMSVNSTMILDLKEIQNTLNTTSNSNLDNFLKFSSSSNFSNFIVENERPTRPSNTLFWLDDLLAKIDLMQNNDEKLGSLLGNLTLPMKPHCGNVGLSSYNWKMYNLFLVLIQYFIPLLILVFAYTKMGLKLKETDERRIIKRSSSKVLQRINTKNSEGGGFSSSSVRTTNNLNASPGTGNCNMQMAIELQQTGGQTTNQIKNTLQKIGNKRCRSLGCSPLEERACLMKINSERKSSQQSNMTTGRHSPYCINCKPRIPCTEECCREILISNNNNECVLNKNVPISCNALVKKGSYKCKKIDTMVTNQHHHEHCLPENCTHSQRIQHYHQNSLSRSHHQSPQSPSQPQNSPHHSSLQPTGSIHSNLMTPMISHSMSSSHINKPHTEYIVANKKRVIKMLFIVCSLFAFLWMPLQTYNLLKDFFFEINSYRYINVIWFIMHFMAMTSASTNPFIYAIYSLRN